MSSDLTTPQRRTVEAAYQALGPPRLSYCPLQPAPRQEAFLLLRQLEVLYGGAAAGGKTVALLMAALQYLDVPGYHALLLRPSLVEFQQPGGLIELSHTWLADTKAVWSGELKCWRVPGPGRTGSGGSSLGFGYLADLGDVGRYAGTSYSFVGFDELVRFTEQQYQRMFRVLRQPGEGQGASVPAPDGTRLGDVPVRMRATSNPGGSGHAWVKTRFVDPTTRAKGAIFLASRLEDNPFIDSQTYVKSLTNMPGSERERLLHGDWEITDDGELFQRCWFDVIDPRQRTSPITRAVRYWDLAGTDPGAASPDPDYTVGLRLELDRDGTFYVRHIVRVRKAPGAVERLVATTAREDGTAVQIVIEQEPGAAGVALFDRYKREVLRGYAVRSDRPSGAKDVRARPVAAAAENGLVKIIRGPNLLDFLDELSAFPNAPHDDCVDALAGAHAALAKRPIPMLRAYVARSRIPDPADLRAANHHLQY
jgi:predicted phage terminase large subunit-like protein